MEEKTEIVNVPKIETVDISKTIFNAFVITLRKKVRTAANFTERGLKSKCKALKEGKDGKVDQEKERKKNAKIESYEEQIAAMKNFTLLDIGKFVVLVEKPLHSVLSDPKTSVEEKALTRIAYNKHIVKDVQDFRKKHPNWRQKIPNFIKSLGINYRKVRMVRLKKNQEKKKKVLVSEKKLLELLNDVVSLGVDAKLLEKMNSEKTVKKNGKEDKGEKKVVEDVKSLSNAEKIETPVKITSIFENIADNDNSDKEEENEDEVMEEEKEEEEVVLETKQLKKREKKSNIITKPGKTIKTITGTENCKIVNNNNNNNKRKVKSNTKELTSNPPKKTKLRQTPSVIGKENKEFKEDSSKEPVRLARDNEIIKKQNRGTSKVTILKLSKVDRKNKRSVEEEESELLKSGEREGALSESEDENFLKTRKVLEKKKKKTSSFFVGRMERAVSESGSDLDGSSPEDEAKARLGLKPILNNRLKRKTENDEDPSNYDSTKFFKSKLFRGDDSSNSSSGTRGGRFAGRGGNEKSFSRGRGGNERSFRGGGGGRGRGSFRDADSKFGEKKYIGGRTGDFENRDRQSFRGRGRGRGHFGNNDKRDSFSNDREGRRFSDNGRGSRGGFAGRGRAQQSEDFSQSSNFVALGNKKSLANNKESGSLLHPSWAAKKKQMEQVAITNFQGTRIVFDD